MSRFFLLFLFLLPRCLSAQNFPAPRAAKVPHQTIIHGDTLTDDYAWLREKRNPDVINFLYASNAYAEDKMKSTSTLQKVLYEEFRSYMHENHDTKPRKRGNYWYFTRTEQDREYNSIWRKKDSLKAQEQLVLDLNKLADEYMYFNIGIYELSPNQELVAYGIDQKGNNINKLFIRSISGDSIFTVDTIPQALDMEWAADNKTFYYTTPENKTNRSYRLYRHILGRSYVFDELIMDESDKTMQLSINKSSSDSFLFAISSRSRMNEVWYWNANDSTDKPKLYVKRRDGLIYSLNHFSGNEFYIEHNFNAPNRALAKAPITPTNPELWKNSILPGKNASLQSYIVFPNTLVYLITKQAEFYIVCINLTNGKTDTLQLPFAHGTVSIGAEDYHYPITSDFQFSIENKIHPSETWNVHVPNYIMQKQEQDTLPVPYSPNAYETKRIWAPAHDGVLIPITLAYKKGMVLNGNNPVLMTGYGSYGASSFPGFSTLDISCMNRGIIIAQTHIRGGQELGEDWYEQGKMSHKKNTFLDFISCAEFLIKQNYTRPGKIAAQGGSAGGLLMGAVANMRPDLFKCIVANVPFVDVMNTMLDETIPLTTFEYEEWGNPHNKKQYMYMRSYSPYDNVRACAYPDMLITAGYDDSQVGYWEPAKWYNRLYDLKTDTNLLLLKTAMNGGHQGSSGKYNQLKERAFDAAFIMQSLGIRENYIKINGKVVDSKNEAVAYANVYIEETHKGTQTNNDGEFELTIKDPFNTTLVVQCISYEKQKIKIGIKTRIHDMLIRLKNESSTLPTVIVKANATDPSLRIIKETIKHRKENDDRIKTIQCDVYMRNQVRLTEIPKKIPSFLHVNVNGDQVDSNDIGLVYLSEAVNHYEAENHGRNHETMLGSKVAGQKQGFSWNRVSDVLMNFYQPTIDISYYSERPFISPIAPLATLSYKYTYKGTILVDGQFIYKIQVIPMRKGEPLFSGILYITQNDYQVYGADLMITKDANISFVDTVLIQQEMMQIDGTWLPMQLKISSKIKVFGFKAGDMNVARISNYIVNRPFPKNHFNYEVFKMERDAMKKDSGYWKNARTILLTEEESQHYRKSDSILTAHSSQKYLDSMDRVHNRLSWSDVVLGGYDYTKTTDSTRKTWHFDGIPLSFGFNTVEGMYVNYGLNYSIYNKENRDYKNTQFHLRYGISNEQIAPHLEYTHELRNSAAEIWKFSVGRKFQQYNDLNPIAPFFNALYSLMQEKNYGKYYYRDEIRTQYIRELINGLFISGDIQLYRRQAALNSNRYSFPHNPSTKYTSNDPLNPDNQQAAFETHSGLFYALTWMYVPFRTYENYGNRKSSGSSKWPELYGSFTHNFALQSASFNYVKIEAGIGKDFNLLSLGELSLDVRGGQFFHTKAILFPDYAHFNGNATAFIQNENDAYALNSMRFHNASFMALPYYTFSTTNAYLQMHAKQNFRGFFLDKIPLVRKLHASEVIGMNALSREGLNYTEGYIGISNILSVLDIYAGKVLSNQNNDWFIRFGLQFGLH